MEEHLEAFSNLREQAIEAFPIIENRLSDLTENFSESVNAAITKSNESTQSLSNTLNEQSLHINSLLDDIKNNFETIAAKFGQSIEGMFHETSELIEKNISGLDDALSEELTKSLESLGRQLASLSTKFVEDYSPLTDKLREVVRISERFDHGSSTII